MTALRALPAIDADYERMLDVAIRLRGKLVAESAIAARGQHIQAACQSVVNIASEGLIARPADPYLTRILEVVQESLNYEMN